MFVMDVIINDKNEIQSVVYEIFNKNKIYERTVRLLAVDFTKDDFYKEISDMYRDLVVEYKDYTNVDSYDKNMEVAYLMAILLNEGYIDSLTLTMGID